MDNIWQNRDIEDLPGERWLPCCGHESTHWASNMGRIKRNGLTNLTHKKESICAQHLNFGYPRISLGTNKTKKKHFVHRLIALTFISNPENKLQVNHRSGQKTDNRVENLEWNSVSENHLHAFRAGLKKPSRAHLGRFGKLHHRSIPVLQLDINGEFIRKWESARMAACALGISQPHISDVANGKRNHVNGFKWKKA